ncbi:hypothetical protein [Streptantibioticus silvisoli]|uniref:Uncharacterized protein n=1 Tax=Streptantibioticus silvisoli TaxID=2705255 RepID=A0ABT6W4P3_9ACTN|nr:hypothetical protein [Streptantibioticus silvisoli]MDI5965726.1 hypothetical protein [Streptantibioticus silvisoli]
MTGASTNIDLMSVTDVWLSVSITGTSTGTSPTLTVGLDVRDPDGNWFPSVLAATELTAGPGRVSACAGLHMPSAAAMVLPRWARVTWTIGGTNPVFPGASICLVGR